MLKLAIFMSVSVLRCPGSSIAEIPPSRKQCRPWPGALWAGALMYFLLQNQAVLPRVWALVVRLRNFTGINPEELKTLCKNGLVNFSVDLLWASRIGDGNQFIDHHY
ncbi:hypothetical protein [Phaeobacter sp. B1627]|uniref:hypothetical protein n=1 Tax=Phaeobacter sp. B1627 TaxID=2583809 RepID=UPI00111AFD78|nr:hypothetical protein [Phaeobacter sp. B1627]TNJ44046.1 hypothetical protein FGE21_08770 [Phaeobacter sp. B1627]